MPGQVRSNKKAAKIADEILQTPKELQTGKPKKPSKETQELWDKDSRATT